MAGNKVLKWLGFTALGALILVGVKKGKDFLASLTISIAKLDVDFRNIFKGNIILKVLTNIDNQSNLAPTVTGVLVRIYTRSKDGSTWSQVGQSKPLGFEFKVFKGRKELLTEIELSAASLGISIASAQTLEIKVESTVLTNLSLPLITEYIYTVNINGIAKSATTILTSVKDLFKKQEVTEPATI